MPTLGTGRQPSPITSITPIDRIDYRLTPTAAILPILPYEVTEFEATPNPNAMKVWLDRPVSEGMRSFLDSGAAAEDPLASALFSEAGATSVLFGGLWLTVNKRPEDDWRQVKSKITRILRNAQEREPSIEH